MRERMTEHRGGDEAHSSPPSQPAIKQIGRHARRKESIRQRPPWPPWPPWPPRPPRAAACGKPWQARRWLLSTTKNSGRYSAGRECEKFLESVRKSINFASSSRPYLRETKVVENDVFKLFQNIAPFLITINSYGRITVPSVKLVEHPRGERRRV